MSDEKTNQLKGLRDCLLHRSDLTLDVLGNCMSDFIFDMDLKSKLINPVSEKAIWYCLHHSNASRDVLVGKLFEYFVDQKGIAENRALELISYALFLGGVDSQLSSVKKPEKSRHNGNTGSYHGGHKAEGGRNRKWLLPAALVAGVVLLVIILIRSCGGTKDETEAQCSIIDVCRSYEGSIEKGPSQKACQMTISMERPDELKISVVNIYNPNDRTEYVGHLKKDKLVFREGPDLVIKKTPKGQVTLSCDERKQGKWRFVSR